MKRRWLPFLMLVVLGYQCLGYPLAFMGTLLGHRMTVAAEMDEAQGISLKSIQLSSEEFASMTWRSGRDFLYQGKMHDLKLAMKQADGNWTLLCMEDERESLMLANGAQTFEEEGESDTSTSLEEAPAYTQPAQLDNLALIPERIQWPNLAPQGRSLAMDILSPPPRMG